MIAEIVKVKVIGQKFSCIYRVSNIYDRVCIEIHDTRYAIHDVFVYRVPNSAPLRSISLLSCDEMPRKELEQTMKTVEANSGLEAVVLCAFV